MDWYGGKKYEITKDKTDWKANPVKVSIKDWVEYMLPPQGLPGKTEDQVKQAQANDATVVNWKWDGTLALNEPETPHKWADYESPTPLKRPAITFDPQTGKLAFPWLRPHLGKRPPFAPNHGGAPWLEPFRVREDGTRSTEQAKPGEQGPWSLVSGKFSAQVLHDSFHYAADYAQAGDVQIRRACRSHWNDLCVARGRG